MFNEDQKAMSFIEGRTNQVSLYRRIALKQKIKDLEEKSARINRNSVWNVDSRVHRDLLNSFKL